MTSYAIDNYTLENALNWGNFKRHCNKALTGNLEDRLVHVIIAAFELLPIIGQIISVFEMIILKPYSRNTLLINRAISSAAIKELHDKANATPSPGKLGEWTITFVDESDMEFQAACNYTNREIKIWTTLSDDSALTFYVFELTNCIQNGDHEALHQKILRGQISREEFAKESERIEHVGTQIHHRVMSQAIKEMNWSPSLDIYKHQMPSFKINWLLIKDSRHAEYYRENWDRITLHHNVKA